MKIPVKEQVPIDVYDADFLGIEATTHDDWGDGLLWSWKITKSKYRGQIVYRTTKPWGTARNSCGDFLKSITELPLEQAKLKDLDDYVGTPCSVIVKESKSGSTRVESFVVLHPDKPAEADDVEEVPFDV